MEKAIYKHSTLVLLLSHLVYSHITGLDLPKALVAIVLVALRAYNKYLQKLEIPDINKELDRIKLDLSSKIEKVDIHLKQVESSMSKYDAFIIKNPASSSKNIRF